MSHGHPENAVLAQNVVTALVRANDDAMGMIFGPGWRRSAIVVVVREALDDSEGEVDVHTTSAKCGAVTSTPNPSGSGQRWEHECSMRIPHEDHQCAYCDHTWPREDKR